MIRTALLCVPALDEVALDGVRALLRGLPGVVVLEEQAVAAQRTWIAEVLRRWCDEAEMDLVLTLGGTLPAPGPAAAEIVPEATLDVLDRLTPALPETMRADALAVTPLALLDRGVAGIRSRTLIVNLPEGAAAALFLEAVVDLLPAILAHLQGDPAAPRLADVDVNADPGSAPLDKAPSARSGLDAGEFAAFLRRNTP